MALNIKDMARVFKHGEIELSDPAETMSPDDVLSFYSNTYPELTNANVHGPEIKDGIVEYVFKSVVGTKG